MAALTDEEKLNLPKTKYGNILKQDPSLKKTSLFIPVYPSEFYTHLLDSFIDPVELTDDSPDFIKKVKELQKKFKYGYDVSKDFFDVPAIEDGAFTNIEFWDSILQFYSKFLSSRSNPPKVSYYDEVILSGLLDADDDAIRAADWTETINMLQVNMKNAVNRAIENQAEKKRMYTEIKETEKGFGEPLAPEEMKDLKRYRKIVGPSETVLNSPDWVGEYQTGKDVTVTVPGTDYTMVARYVPVKEGEDSYGDMYVLEIGDTVSGLEDFLLNKTNIPKKDLSAILNSYKDLLVDAYGDWITSGQFWFDHNEMKVFTEDLALFIQDKYTTYGAKGQMESKESSMDKREAGFNLFKDYDYTQGTWAVDKKAKTIKRKPQVSVESAIRQKGAWSYGVNDEVLIDIDAFEFTPVVIEAQLPGLQYQVRTSSGNTLTVAETDIVDATVDMF